ncbi:MAG TPA: OB-fold nucleic acid binding domain-containing protein, partial [bacterium]|nr:OB-fold nucleic acid binding domain-containing protein [bacterium]
RRWQPVIDGKATTTIAQLPDLRDRQEVVVGGLVGAVKRSITRSGSAMAFLTLEDLTGSVEVLVFPRAYEQQGFVLKRDAVVLLRGKVDIDEQGAKLLCDEVIALPATPEEAADLQIPPPAPRGRGDRYGIGRSARNGTPPARAATGAPTNVAATATAVRVAPQSPGPDHGTAVRSPLRIRVTTREEIEQLYQYLEAHPGERQVCAHVVTDTGEHVIPIQLRLADAAELQQELEQVFGEGNVWEE